MMIANVADMARLIMKALVSGVMSSLSFLLAAYPRAHRRMMVAAVVILAHPLRIATSA
jgi:hypothetical protein